jgi:FkbM family methyltransferase
MSAVNRALRTAVSYAPSSSVLWARELRDLPRVARGKPHEADFELFRSLPTSGASVLDIGANRGQSIRSFRAVLDAPEITAFEPNPHLAAFLRRRFGGDVEVVIHDRALSDDNGTIQLAIPQYGHTLYDTRASLSVAQAESFLNDEMFLAFDPARARVEQVTVPVARLDSFELDPEIMKIDVEGVAARVLAGAEKTLERARPIVMIEEPDEAVRGVFSDLGYSRFGFSASANALRTDPSGELNEFFLTDAHLATVVAGGVTVG